MKHYQSSKKYFSQDFLKDKKIKYINLEYIKAKKLLCLGLAGYFNSKVVKDIPNSLSYLKSIQSYKRSTKKEVNNKRSIKDHLRKINILRKIKNLFLK
jgi:hypothetical protein